MLDMYVKKLKPPQLVGGSWCEEAAACLIGEMFLVHAMKRLTVL